MRLHAPALSVRACMPWALAGFSALASAGMQFDFDLPAQPLSTALDRFAGITGRAALFGSGLVDHRLSAPLQGRYTPEAALRRLIEGSGLAVEEVHAGEVAALVLKPAAQNGTPAGAGAIDESEGAAAPSRHDGLVQQRVLQALCTHPRTAAPGYRALVRVEPGPADASGTPGGPMAVRLLAPTGDAERDAALVRLLRRVHVESPEGGGTSLTLLILPGTPEAPACSAPGVRP